MAEDLDYEGESGTIETFRDPVAERVAEYRKLLEVADKTKNAELRKESLQMLKRVRLSFGAQSEIHVSVVPGGKATE